MKIKTWFSIILSAMLVVNLFTPVITTSAAENEEITSDVNSNDKENSKLNAIPYATRYSIRWVVDGSIDKTSKVNSGDVPSYGDFNPTKRLNGQRLTFEGWSTVPNSYKDIVDPIPAATEDATYYAIFSYQANFYFVLEGSSNESTEAKDYMYMGSGRVIVPDNYTGQRWYNSQVDIDSLVIEYPSDAAIRKGLDAAYTDYSDEWTYDLTYTTYMYASSSVGYDYKDLDKNMRSSIHIDAALTLNRNDRAGIQYVVTNPNGSITTNSVVHKKQTVFDLQNTVRDNGSFVTDGKEYESTKNEDGIKYTFDGWYTDTSYTQKAPDTLIVTEPRTFYARYIADTKDVTYLANGGMFADNSTSKNSKQTVGANVRILSEVPTKVGYLFAGWTSDDVVLNTNGSYTMPDKNVTFSAQWVKDETQQKKTSYTVHYMLDGVEKEADKVVVTGSAWINDDPAMIEIAEGGISAPTDKYVGYRLVESQTYPAAGTRVTSGSEYWVYYVRDEQWTKPTKYTIHYAIDGAVQESVIVEGNVWINDPEFIAIKEGGIPTPTDKYVGYKLDEKNPVYPIAGTMVASGSEYTVNYVKDESQIKPTFYEIHYFVDGIEQENDTLIVHGEAWINDDPAQIAIAEGGIPTPAKKYEGYKLAENQQFPEAGAFVADGTKIRVDYVKDEEQTKPTFYEVRYIVDDVEQTEDRLVVTGSAWVNDNPAMIAIAEGGILAPTDKYVGYRLVANQKFPQAGTFVENETVIEVFYVRNEQWTKPTKYTIHYAIDGAVQESVIVEGNVWINDPEFIAIKEGGIPTPTDKYVGYKLDAKNPVYPTAGTMVASGSEYTVNYVKDESQIKPTFYEIHYFVDGVEQENDTLIVHGEAWINDDPVQIAIAEGGIPTPAKKYEGYKLAENQQFPEAGAFVADGTKIRVDYVKDEEQTKPTFYEIHYFVDGVEQENDALIVHGEAWINDDPAQIAIAEGGIPTPAKKYEGYKLVENQQFPAAQSEVASGSVYNVYYVKDESQTKETFYEVHYFVDGIEQVEDKMVVRSSAWIHDNPTMIKIAEGGIPTPQKKGYKLDEGQQFPAAQSEVASGSVYNVYYVKDESQTKETFYEVHYFVDGVEQVEDKMVVRSSAWINDNPAMIEIAEGGIPADDNKYEGYRRADATAFPNAKDKVVSGTIFRVEYERNDEWTKPTEYTIHYAIEGVVQESIVVRSTVWINDPEKITIKAEGIVAPVDKYVGYKLDENNPVYPTAGTSVDSKSEYTVNYVKDEAQTKPTFYEIHYFVDGVEQENDTLVVNSEAWINDDPVMIKIAEGGIPTPANKYLGYKLVENQQLPVAHSEVESGSQYNVYYVKDETQTKPTFYEIHYFVDGVEQENDTLVVNSEAWINDDPAMIMIAEGGIPTPADKYLGYKLAENQLFPSAQSSVENGSRFDVYYVKESYPFEIHYFYDDIDDEAARINGMADFNTTLSDLYGHVNSEQFFNGEHYIFEKLEGADRIEAQEQNIVNIYYVKDEVGNGGEADGIADKYQVRVNFEAINGRIDGNEVVYVTLYDKEGRYAENGVGHLTSEQIPAALANEGYEGGSWNIEPTQDVEIVEDTTFTITFTAIEEVIIPENPTPQVPVTPTPVTPQPIEIPENPTPLVPVTPEPEPEPEPQPIEIPEPDVPLAPAGGSWALVNLIASAITVLLGVAIVLGKLKKEEDAENDETENALKRRKWTKVLGALISITSVIAFMLTEDMSLPMSMVDEWTIFMVVMALANVVVLVVGRKWKDTHKEDKTIQQA